MRAGQMKERATEAVTSIIGSVAGAMADPKTGFSRAKSTIVSGRTLLVAATVVAAYFAGRRAASREE